MIAIRSDRRASFCCGFIGPSPGVDLERADKTAERSLGFPKSQGSGSMLGTFVRTLFNGREPGWLSPCSIRDDVRVLPTGRPAGRRCECRYSKFRLRLQEEILFPLSSWFSPLNIKTARSRLSIRSERRIRIGVVNFVRPFFNKRIFESEAGKLSIVRSDASRCQ